MENCWEKVENCWEKVENCWEKVENCWKKVDSFVICRSILLFVGPHLCHPLLITKFQVIISLPFRDISTKNSDNLTVSSNLFTKMAPTQ